MTVVQIRGRRTGQRSKVTTRSNMFIEGDGRSPWAGRWSDLIFAHTNDLGSAETLSEAQISICRRAATLECELEAMEGRMSAGRPIEIEVYGRLCGRLCRLFEMIGVRRVTRAPDPLNDLAWAFAVGARALDDDEPGDEDQPLPIEEGFDREPGEA